MIRRIHTAWLSAVDNHPIYTFVVVVSLTTIMATIASFFSTAPPS